MEACGKTVLFYARRTPEAVLRRFDRAEKICADTIGRGMLCAHQDDALVFVFPNCRIGEITALCRKAGCKDVRVVIPDNGACFDPIRVDVEKPRLDYLETELTRICNLHCRGCCDYIQLAEGEPPFYDLETFIRDLEQLKQFFWGIEKIRLMGGEPLMQKRIAEFAEHTRRLFPDTDLRIVTNGLLIPSLSVETLQRLKNCGSTFDISNYPPTLRKKKEIASVLQKAGVSYDFGIPIRYFFRTIAEKPSDDPKLSFDNCLFTRCHMLLEGGILAPCSYAACVGRLNRHFGTHYPETDVVDLYRTDLDGWQILQWMSAPHLFCTCCTRGMVPIRWKDGVHAKQAVPEDWIVRENLLTGRAFPLMQRVLKPAEHALRGFLQRNKL